MKTKKDIGPVFKEALKNYKVSPDNSVWKSLEANLKAEKKRRRIIIIWFIGALSILIPLFFAVDHFTTPENDAKKIETPLREKAKSKKEPTSPDNNTNPIVNRNEDNNISKSNSLIPNTPIVKKKKQSKLISSNTSEKTKEKKKEHPIQTDNSKNKATSKDTISGNTLKDKNSNNFKKEPVAELEKKETNTKKKKKKNRKPSIKTNNITIKQKSNDGWQWKVFPFVSLDHYNAFKLKTSNQFTYNYGFHLNFYTFNDVSLRIGFKKMNLQYSFDNNGVSNQQKVSYIEIPLEAKYLFTTDKFVNPSFIGGVSYLYLQDASLATPQNTTNNKDDFINNIISFNVGFGLQKSLGKNFSINVETFFKYQYRTYSKTVGFSPYTFSINTGIEYHF